MAMTYPAQYALMMGHVPMHQMAGMQQHIPGFMMPPADNSIQAQMAQKAQPDGAASTTGLQNTAQKQMQP